MIKRLAPFAKNQLLYSILCPLAIIAEVQLEVRIPFLMARVVDEGIMPGNISAVKSIGLQMVVMAMLSLVMGILAARFAAIAGMGFGHDVRGAIFEKIQSFSFANFDRFNTATLVTRLTTDVNTVQNVYMMVLRIFVRAPLMFATAIVYAVRLNPSLASMFAVAAPLIAAGMAIIGTKAYPRFRSMFKKYDRFNASVQENLIAIRVVKSFVRARHEKEKFKASNDDLRNASISAEKLMIVTGPLMTIVMYSCIIAALWLGGNQIISQTGMQLGELSSFVSYISQILISLMMISVIFVMSVMSRASVTRLVEVLDEKSDISDNGADPSLEVADGSVEFRNVCFKYDPSAQNDVLHLINVSIASGETVGIIGSTGAAKTTLVQLIPRLYDITGGELYVGGRRVTDYTLDNLRSAVSMVLQNNLLFSGSIEENLRWGDENASEEELEAALRAAQAYDFVQGFPEGINMDLGQGGVNVSGGQKQRLCIARALLKKPKILILDDSTSAVDTATEASIRKSFAEEIPGTTKIIIAQRISSVEHADKIIVLDDGRIDAVGTHEELVENNEIYKEVYLSQLEGSVA